MSKSAEAFMVEAWKKCTHPDKAPLEAPTGGTICLACAAKAAKEFLRWSAGVSSCELPPPKLVINPGEPRDDPSRDHPLECDLR